MTTTQLTSGKSATVAANGTATVTIGPNGVETWDVSTIGVQVSTNTLEPIAKVYLNTISPTTFIGGTYTGSNDSSDQSVTLLQGQTLICQWTTADVGATATLSLYGTKNTY